MAAAREDSLKVQSPVCCQVCDYQNSELTMQGGPERMQHLRSIISRQRGRKWKSCVHWCVYHSFPSKMSPRWRRFDSMGVFLRQCHFQNLPLLSQNSQFDVPQISIVCLPRVKCLLLLWKTKTAWIKRSIYYVTLLRYNPGEATQRNSSRPQSWLLIEKKQILKMTLPQQNGSRIKTPSLKLLILVSFCWKKNFLRINALTDLI